MRVTLMKQIATVMLMISVLGGCVAGNPVTHADDPAASTPSQGPVLCRDGTAPPCVPRD